MSEKKKIMAVDITRATTVANPQGGAIDVRKGAVLLVGSEVTSEDAAYLVALGKASPCAPGLKTERAKAAAKESKESEK
jgi:hypothetical protein